MILHDFILQTLTTIVGLIRGIGSLPARGKEGCRSRGFTIVELIITMAILGTLASIATGYYHEYIEKARVIRAIAEIKNIDTAIAAYMVDNDPLPASLADVGYVNFLDPWENPYQYYNIETGGIGHARKDRFLVPINSDYDLYSMGKDGLSRGPLTAKASKDDIIRANDGGYIGLAKDY